MAPKVTFEPTRGATGWNAPPSRRGCSPLRTRQSTDESSQPAALKGGGGTIPFMGMLGTHYPQAQFLITGVLGPKSNAHGPNEFIHIAYAKS